MLHRRAVVLRESFCDVLYDLGFPGASVAVMKAGGHIYDRAHPRHMHAIQVLLRWRLLQKLFFGARTRGSNQRVLGSETTAAAIYNGDAETGYIAPWILLGSCMGILRVARPVSFLVVPAKRSRIDGLSTQLFRRFNIRHVF